MAGALKHVKRSHRSASKNYSQYVGFVSSATKKAKARDTNKMQRIGIIERIARLFKHQEK
jgi:hypothetical protein